MTRRPARNGRDAPPPAPADGQERRYVVSVEGREVAVTLRDGPGGLAVAVDGQEIDISIEPVEAPRLAGRLAGQRFRALARREGEDVVVVLGGEALRLQVRDRRQQLLAQAVEAAQAVAQEQVIRAPMPGLVVGLPVTAGETVEAGACVAVLQAMKMENELRTTAAGRVAEVRVAVGQVVEQRQVLVVVR